MEVVTILVVCWQKDMVERVSEMKGCGSVVETDVSYLSG